ncbi:MAG: hypothetical protein AUK47_13695 [Deltaproteobacteria bacterium CG2_30_63_29]|nr:MAG: hypothetical protein AUK47_13695 [Deltaproteobacteria bacterium CG2_30_63_29]
MSNRKDSIIEAAQKVFAKKGRSGATTGEIARTAGCSASAIYKHFESKEQLYEVTMQRYFDETMAILDDELPFKVSVADHLRWVILRLFKMFVQDSALARIAAAYQLMEPGDSCQRLQVRTKLEALLAEGIESGEFRPADPRLYVMTLGGFFHAWLMATLDGESLSPEQAVEAMMDVFLNGVLAAPKATPAEHP